MKNITWQVTLLVMASAFTFQTCSNRDDNGNTDANNTKNSKNYTDSSSVDRITLDSASRDSLHR